MHSIVNIVNNMARYINTLKVAKRPHLNVLITTRKDNYVIMEMFTNAMWSRKWQSLQYSCWKILWTEEPGRLQSVGPQSVGHD